MEKVFNINVKAKNIKTKSIKLLKSTEFNNATDEARNAGMKILQKWSVFVCKPWEKLIKYN